MTVPDLPPRTVTLVLCTRGGDLLGVLPSYEVAVPWWQEAGPVVAVARQRFGVEVTVLRLLEARSGWGTAGGAVTYLAEVAAPASVALATWTGADPLADHPLRLSYARPGGPAADVAWAEAVLEAAGRPSTAPAVQVRTWNLSSIWRLPTAGGTAWLKVVPPFFAHEGAMLQRLDPLVVPPLIAAEGPRVLLDDVPGEDHYGAELPVLTRIVALLVGLQTQWAGRVGELEDIGAPDWRCQPFAEAVARLLDVAGSALDSHERARLRDLVDALPARFAALAECGIPDSLVHGDFHPGNTHGSPTPDGRIVLLDWGDCGIGHPLLDQAAALASIPPEQRGPLREHWARLWRATVPGSDPHRAAELLAPIRALRQALVYRTFLDGIEPDEHVYHSGDPARWLREAAAT